MIEFLQEQDDSFFCFNFAEWGKNAPKSIYVNFREIIKSTDKGIKIIKNMLLLWRFCWIFGSLMKSVQFFGGEEWHLNILAEL